MQDLATARILVVDDEPRQLKAVCEVLRENGCPVVGVTSASEALELLTQDRYELLLTDLIMPDMDGIALLRKAIALDPFIAGIVMTGQGTIGTAVDAFHSGALEYMQKPFRVGVALQLIRASLATRQLRLENADLQRRERQRTEELEYANKELAAFTAAVSHDLRNPLQVINSAAWILSHRYGEMMDEDGKDGLQMLQSAALKMGTLIEDLLKLARVTDTPPHVGVIDVTDICRRVATELQRQNPTRSVEVHIEEGLTAFADGHLVTLALDNLIGNAWKYTSKVEHPQIWIGRDIEDKRQPFFVMDNGAGFPADQVAKLFQPFKRLHLQSEFPGTGIGLTTVRRVIERHGGRIWAKGATDQGATFFFTLPTTRENAEQRKSGG